MGIARHDDAESLLRLGREDGVDIKPQLRLPCRRVWTVAGKALVHKDRADVPVVRQWHFTAQWQAKAQERHRKGETSE